MALNYKNRRRLALFLLVVWLPVYIVGVVTLMGMIDRPPFLIELGIYLLLGVLWAVPFKWVFMGVGKADPDAPEAADDRPDDADADTDTDKHQPGAD